MTGLPGSLAGKGRPLAFMVLVIAVWVTGRVAFGSLPFERPTLPPLFAGAAAATPQIPGEADRIARSDAHPSTGGKGWRMDPVGRIDIGAPMPLVERDGFVEFPAGPVAAAPVPRPATTWVRPSRAIPTASSHNLMWFAAMARLPVPDEVADLLERAATAPAPVRAGATLPSSRTALRPMAFESWLLLRPDGGDGALSAPRSAYGRSQAGVVMRYRLAPSSKFEPVAHARASRALASGGESELALGAGVRPLASLPLRVHAEARLTRQGGRTELRPSAFATAGFDDVDLPASLKGRGYLQVGWVGGRFATPFVDGQAQIARDVAKFDGGTLTAGVGAWGGAQKGAGRLDIGPSATVTLRLGEAPLDLSVDYRLRIAGAAEPASGPALTLSKAF